MQTAQSAVGEKQRQCHCIKRKGEPADFSATTHPPSLPTNKNASILHIGIRQHCRKPRISKTFPKQCSAETILRQTTRTRRMLLNISPSPTTKHNTLRRTTLYQRTTNSKHQFHPTETAHQHPPPPPSNPATLAPPPRKPSTPPPQPGSPTPPAQHRPVPLLP